MKLANLPIFQVCGTSIRSTSAGACLNQICCSPEFERSARKYHSRSRSIRGAAGRVEAQRAHSRLSRTNIKEHPANVARSVSRSTSGCLGSLGKRLDSFSRVCSRLVDGQYSKDPIGKKQEGRPVRTIARLFTRKRTVIDM